MILLVLILTALIPGMAFAQSEVTIVSDKDNTLYESGTGVLSNGAGIHFFAGKTFTNLGGPFIRRGLISFDIAGNVESGATINSAVLTLTVTQTATGAQDVKLHRVSADWGEGTSNAVSSDGRGTASTTGDVTWIHTFFNTSSWTNPGGDFSLS